MLISRQPVEVYLRCSTEGSFAGEGRAGFGLVREEATVAEIETFLMTSSGEIETVPALACCVDGEASFCAFVPLSTGIGYPGIAVESPPSDMSVTWREAFEKRMKSPQESLGFRSTKARDETPLSGSFLTKPCGVERISF